MAQCIVCGTEFIPTRTDQKYCSPACRNHNPAKSARTREFQQKRRKQINAIKLEAGCRRCGYREHPAALDFNHIHGEKLFNISQDTKRKWQDILDEIAKCEVLCHNCHSIHTFEERHFVTKRKDYSQSTR